MSGLKRAAFFAKAVAFTLAIHGAVLTLLLYGFSWSQSPAAVKSSATPVTAVAVSARDVDAYYQKRRREQAKQQKETARAAAAREKLLRAEKAAKRKLEEQKKKKIAEEKKQIKLAAQRKADEERRIKLAEQRKLDEEQRQREVEQKRKAEEDRRRRETAEQREAEAARVRLETKRGAESALKALIGRIRDKVKRNWRRPPTSHVNLFVLIKVQVAADGRVISAAVTRGSGDPFFDQSAIRAVQKSSPLPFPSRPDYYEFIRTFVFKFSPDSYSL